MDHRNLKQLRVHIQKGMARLEVVRETAENDAQRIQ